MMEKQSESGKAEELRIKEAYSKRNPNDNRYSFFNPGQLFRIQQIERRLLSLLRQRGFEPLSTKTILEVGCGTGSWLRKFVTWGAKPENITGIDLLPERVTQAKQLSPATMTIQCGNASQLALPDASFDLVFQSTVFTSILDSRTKQQIAAEMLRVVRSDGLIVWYDYHVNNPWNPDVRGVKKREIHELFPRCHIGLQRITLAPPLGQWLAPRSWVLAYLLEKIPLLCTHTIGIIRKTD
jgi:ubiquinone/menaquinone biosynthesis C-methylase UbiE